ncbi:phage tail tube protein [Nocardiopsis alba]
MNDPLNVTKGLVGRAYYAPLGTTSPTTSTSTWGTGWVNLGLLGEDGLSRAKEEDREEHTPWGYKSPVRSDITSATETFTFNCWETNAHTRALYEAIEVADMESNNGDVTYTVSVGGNSKEYMFGFDIIDTKLDKHFRYVLPRAEVTSREELTYSQGAIIGYGFTVTAYGSSDDVLLLHMTDALVLPVTPPGGDD